MSPDSPTVELLAVVAAVLAAAVLGFTWNVAGGWRRALLRSAAITACLATMAVAGLTWVNRQIDLYPTWASIFGSRHAAGGADGTDDAGVPVSAESGSSGSGRIVTYHLAGAQSKLNLMMYAYLPPGYDQHPTTKYPVIEALHGFPGNPVLWLKQLTVAAVLDKEISQGRMAPVVVLFPYQTPDPSIDTECANLPNGPQAETFLTQDVPAFAHERMHVREEPGSWGLIGYSAGAYCATNLLLRHPEQYHAAASLSGQATPGIRIGDQNLQNTYDVSWRLQHLPIPAVALYLACAKSDPSALRGTQEMVHLAHAPISVTTNFVNGGGHNSETWLAMEAPAFDWLSTWLGQPAVRALAR